MSDLKVAIVGAGVSGLFTAYMLASRYNAEVVIIEERYPGYGGTFRCATGIRASFSSVEHVELMKLSIDLWKKLSSELGFEFKQTGYLWVARSEKGLERLRALSRFHNAHGVPTRVIGSDEVVEIAPILNPNRVVGGLYDPTAGKAPVFDVVKSLLKVLKYYNTRMLYGVKALAFKKSGNNIVGIETAKGRIKADAYVLAAGHNSKRLAETAGVALPLTNETKHVVITEAYKHTLDPLVIDWEVKGAPYIVQTKDGGFYMSRDIGDKPGMPLTSHMIDAIPKIVQPLVEIAPVIAELNIIRYWLGYYVTTPDHHPIYGPAAPIENLYLTVGFSGHGYMLGPVTGLITARWIARGDPGIEHAKRLTIERFREGRLIEETVVIG